MININEKDRKNHEFSLLNIHMILWAGRGSNPRPRDYEPGFDHDMSIRHVMMADDLCRSQAIVLPRRAADFHVVSERPTTQWPRKRYRSSHPTRAGHRRSRQATAGESPTLLSRCAVTSPPEVGTLCMPNLHPCCSGCMLVFVDDAAEPVVAADVQAGDAVRIGNR